MVSLANQARLLAAQAFNKAQIEAENRERLAKLEQDRQEGLNRTAKRESEKLALAKNARDRQLIQDSIAQTLASASEKRRQAKVNAEIDAKKKKVFTRVVGGGDIGVLTGFEAEKDSKGKVIGISNRDSATRKNTKRLLLKEIENQRRIANQKTDLESFLENERRLDSGNITSGELNRQIQARKARGLSKTPAQKRAFFRLRDEDDLNRLASRHKRKGRGGDPFKAARAIMDIKSSEAGRAGDLGSKPFADPLFAGGGRTKQAIIARGGTFGRRVGGESFTSQLGFIKNAKAKSTSGRIGFASGLLAQLGSGGIFGGGASQQQLLGLVKKQAFRKQVPKTFEQELRAGQGFFTTVQKPVTKATLSKGARGRLVSARKREDIAKADDARQQIFEAKATTARKQQANRDDLASLSESLLSSNIRRGAEIERQNLEARPRISRGQVGFVPSAREQASDLLGRQLAQQQISDFGLQAGLDAGGIGAQGGSQGGTTIQRVQAGDPTALSLGGEKREFVGTPAQIRQQKNSALKKAGLTPSQIRQVNQGTAVSDLTGSLTPTEKRAIATQRQAETKALRAQGTAGVSSFEGQSFGRGDDLSNIGSVGLVQATGEFGKLTETNRGNIFDVGLQESVGFEDQVNGKRNVGQSFSVELSEDLGFTDRVKAKSTKKKGAVGAPTAQNPLVRDTFFGDISAGLQSAFSFEGLTGKKSSTGGKKGGKGRTFALDPQSPDPLNRALGQVSGGLQAFISIGAGKGGGNLALDTLFEPFNNPNNALSGDFSGLDFSIDSNLDLKERARKQSLSLTDPARFLP